MVVQFSVSDRTINLVSGEVKFIRIFTADNRLTCTTVPLSVASAPILCDENKHSLCIVLSWL